MSKKKAPLPLRRSTDPLHFRAVIDWCEQLGLPMARCSDYQLKVGIWNYYTKGTFHHDGDSRRRGAGFPAFKVANAHTDIAALGLIEDVKVYLDAEADKLAKAWLDEHRIAIKSLTDDRQEEYRQIRGMSAEPQDIDLAKPISWLEATVAREANGDEMPLPTYQHHLMCDAEGAFPAELNSWEKDVFLAEMQREGFEAWYRNPSRASQDSLGVAYKDGDKFKIVRPDFLFFVRLPDGSVVADIVDPHGIHLADALPKLQGMARYAAEHASAYRRIDSIAKIGDDLRVLDLKDPETQKAIETAATASQLYEGTHARTY